MCSNLNARHTRDACASGAGQGQETRKASKNADNKSENIDLLLAVIDAANSAATSKQAKNFIEGVEHLIEAAQMGKDLKENVIDPLKEGKAPENKVTCQYCGSTIPTSDTNGHAGPFKKAEDNSMQENKKP